MGYFYNLLTKKGYTSIATKILGMAYHYKQDCPSLIIKRRKSPMQIKRD